MNNYVFTNEKTGMQYKRISKKEAKKRFINGGNMIVAPCNMRLFTNWGGWSIIDGFNVAEPELEFDRIINSFIYYNCNAEMGYYPSFYIPAGRK